MVQSRCSFVFEQWKRFYWAGLESGVGKRKKWWELCMIMKCKCASSFSSSTLFWPLQTLRKKGFNGCNSPEPDGDDSIDQSPLNDRKTEDLDSLFKRYGVSTVTPLSPFLIYSFCSPSPSLSVVSSLYFSLCLGGLYLCCTGNEGSEQERAPGLWEPRPRGALLPHPPHWGEIQKNWRGVW